MRGYRRLIFNEKESEPIRAMDIYVDDNGDLYSLNGDEEFDMSWHRGQGIWRKARTEGCPPGWRWADAGEVTGKGFCVSPGVWTNWEPRSFDTDADGVFGCLCGVMPYPEDPRLK